MIVLRLFSVKYYYYYYYHYLFVPRRNHLSGLLSTHCRRTDKESTSLAGDTAA